MPLLPTPPSQDWESGWEGRCSPLDSEKERNQGRKLGGDWVPGGCRAFTQAEELPTTGLSFKRKMKFYVFNNSFGNSVSCTQNCI